MNGKFELIVQLVLTCLMVAAATISWMAHISRVTGWIFLGIALLFVTNARATYKELEQVILSEKNNN